MAEGIFSGTLLDEDVNAKKDGIIYTKRLLIAQ